MESVLRTGDLMFSRPGHAGVFMGLLIAALLLASNLRAEELILMAGSGLRGPTDELTARFEERTGHRVLTSYDGGGRHMARIRATGQGDLYMPGASFYIESLRKEHRIRSFRQVVAHTPVVGVSLDAMDRIRTFEDLARPGVRLALGDPKAMALGRTAQVMIQRSGLGQDINENVVVYGATVKQLALYLSRGDVDAAVIGRADAFQFQDRIRMIPIPREYFEPEIIAVALLESARRPEIAERFALFMASREAVLVFCKFGFLPLED